MVVERGWIGAGEAEALAIALDEAVEVDAFAAARAGDALAFVAGEFAGRERDANPLLGKEFVVGELAVGTHLGGVLFELRIKLAGALLGSIEGDDADGFVGIRGELRMEVDEGGGHLAPVAELEGALADAGAGDDADGVGGATIDLDEDNGTLAVGIGLARGQHFQARRVDAEAAHREHRHAHTEDLAGAEMTMRDLGFAEEFVEFDGVDGCGAHEFDATPVSASQV